MTTPLGAMQRPPAGVCDAEEADEQAKRLREFIGWKLLHPETPIGKHHCGRVSRANAGTRDAFRHIILTGTCLSAEQHQRVQDLALLILRKALEPLDTLSRWSELLREFVQDHLVCVQHRLPPPWFKPTVCAPEAVHRADLVIDPDEWPTVGPLDKMTGLPVKATRVVVGRGVRPLHDGQPWQSDVWGDRLVRVIHPGGGPHDRTTRPAEITAMLRGREPPPMRDGAAPKQDAAAPPCGMEPSPWAPTWGMRWLIMLTATVR